MFTQSALITAMFGSLFGFFTLTGVDNAVAKIMVGLALTLVVAILVTDRWDLPYKAPLSET